MEVRAIIAVGIGAAVGGIARYLIGNVFIQTLGPGFPWGTLFINVTGSFFIGLIAQLASTRALGVTPLVRIFAATGILGGYTTFSTFSLDTITLLGLKQKTSRARSKVALKLHPARLLASFYMYPRAMKKLVFVRIFRDCESLRGLAIFNDFAPGWNSILAARSKKTPDNIRVY